MFCVARAYLDLGVFEVDEFRLQRFELLAEVVEQQTLDEFELL